MLAKYKNQIMLLLDCVLILTSYFFSMLLGHDFIITQTHIDNFFMWIPAVLIIYIVLFVAFRLYHSIWGFASVEEFTKVLFANVTGTLIVTLSFNITPIDFLPLNSFFIAMFITTSFTLGIRVSYRIFRIAALNNFSNRNSKVKTMIIGAGNAGNLLIKEIRGNKDMHYNVVCFVDDDKTKLKHTFNGVKVLGTTEQIPELVDMKNIEEIIIAIPSSDKDEIKRIVSICNKTGVKTKILPPFYEVFDQEVNVTKIRDVKIEDLLGRDEIQLDTDGIEVYIQNKTILVTGGGGSIGSELCRQIVKFAPKKLIILDIYENNAYDLQNELKRFFVKHKSLHIPELIVLIASVRDVNRMNEIFKTYKPDVVFHAAAHKHVPLMEDSPKEAIKNNVFGTHNVVKAAHEHNVKKFVLISTDKAVNPTNIMGATKRFAEMIVQAYNKVSETNYAAVRFGNVLGSNGSVIPLFKKQIEEGGPVTVTHKDIIRYFMTIPEASQLVLQAGAYAEGGEIFVLDMGEPVKITELAEKLIRLSGFEPYKEIDIKFTGLRPGEKLYEELLMNGEGLIKTHNRKIFVSQVNGVYFDQIETKLNTLADVIELINSLQLKKEIANFIKTYKVYDEKEIA
ncbi:nucleoside-diphosphate sugar epimerase/dehydratase [Haloplasma contractile]|uniref:1-deoxy-D-xylulose-5-phosphate reductoisomerase protein n=1 Tax=Haloplasma contractile SSD-17B TaxID=1033810 RepID=U2FD68_9MOLU|nr:nucleoside-diphosphate sugar epimerase/dehydratase [Haloplasma contractile]ERJ10945.1 1-deoxy-D-xylulose-5-phosphate reductoisomerase protein [Haloplasma contractile SSD-17B]